jgi:hypothetical protein
LIHRDPEAGITALNMDTNNFVADDLGKKPGDCQSVCKTRGD